MKRSVFLSAVALFAAAAPVRASSDAAWDALFAQAKKACIAASGLKKAAAVGAPTDFSKTVLVLVDGRWPQPHMKGASATFACLYDKTSKKAEAHELMDLSVSAD